MLETGSGDGMGFSCFPLWVRFQVLSWVSLGGGACKPQQYSDPSEK